MTATRIQRIGQTRDLLGESPCWLEASQSLCWIDALGGSLWRLSPASGSLEQHALPAPIGCIAPAQGDAVVVALRNRFARYDFGSRSLQDLAGIPVDDPRVRFNDGKCDPAGHFIAGTLHMDRQPGERLLGGIYRLRTDGRVEQLDDDISFTNGPCFSPDGRTFYVADSMARIIWAYDYDPDGPLRNRRVFLSTERFDCGGDGATTDAEGFVWTVLARAARIARVAPDGTIERVIEAPLTYPTSLCFGGPASDRLYLTSISKSMRLEGHAPQDGGLFLLEDLPAVGLPPHGFVGA